MTHSRYWRAYHHLLEFGIPRALADPNTHSVSSGGQMATTKKPPVLATPGAVLRGLRPSKPTHVPPTQLHR